MQAFLSVGSNKLITKKKNGTGEETKISQLYKTN